jgi:hypothetical protein
MGTWWIVDSATGQERAVQWGQFGDVPAQRARLTNVSA